MKPIAFPVVILALSLVSWSIAMAGGPRTFGAWGWVEEAVIDGVASHDAFGCSLAVSGDRALIGAPGLQNKAGQTFVLARGGSGWEVEAVLDSPAAPINECFGSSVSLDGDTALIGVREPIIWYPIWGAAYVFTREGTTWKRQATLQGHDQIWNDWFGTRVEIVGDRALVVARGTAPAGGVYVFTRQGTSWSEEAKLTPGDAPYDAAFGETLAYDGDTAVVGATYRRTGAGVAVGAAYVYARDGSTWNEEALLVASDGALLDMFGSAVAVRGDTILVAAEAADAGAVNSGAVYVFRRTGTRWFEEAKLVADDASERSFFGSSLALMGERALIGADQDDAGAVNGGAVYEFTRPGTLWRQEAKFTPEVPRVAANFGLSAAADGDRALVGSYGSTPPFPSWGVVYAFERRPLASSRIRTAGGNPASYHVTAPPVLGTTCSATVDLGGTTGHPRALLVGYATPLTLTLPSGSVLLVNVADPRGELLGVAARPGPTASFSIWVPPVLEYAGYELATQALHFGGGSPPVLSNAQDLFLGF